MAIKYIKNRYKWFGISENGCKIVKNLVYMEIFILTFAPANIIFGIQRVQAIYNDSPAYLMNLQY
jgi:hypothetical protein